MFAGVLLGDDLRPGGVQPFVAIGMIEVPVRVDEMGDGIGAESGKSFSDLRARHADAGIDKHLAVRARQHGDVAAGAFEHADIVSELVRVDGRYRGTVLDQADEASRLGKRLARREPSTRCGVSRAADAAEAKASS